MLKIYVDKKKGSDTHFEGTVGQVVDECLNAVAAMYVHLRKNSPVLSEAFKQAILHDCTDMIFPAKSGKVVWVNLTELKKQMQEKENSDGEEV